MTRTKFLLFGLAILATSAVQANPPGDGWSNCAGENQTCDFSGQKEVAYGMDDRYRFQIQNNGTACSNSVFGDPIRGKYKQCWVRDLPTENYLSIDASNPKQSITLMGGDMERSAHFLNRASNSQEIADWFYEDINFAYSRVSYDRQQELSEGSPNMSFYDGTVSAMKLVQNARPSVKFWATLKSDYDGFGTTNNLPDWVYTGGGYNGGSYDPSALNVDKYARFLADFLQHMNDNGVPISVLSVAKEWTQVLDANTELKVMVALTDLMQTNAYDGTPMPEFSGPSTWGVRGATNFMEDMIDLGNLSRYNAISTHSYDNPSEADWATLIQRANGEGQPVWHTESSSGAGGRFNGEEPPISSALDRYASRGAWYRQGLQGEMFFENWSRGVDSETRAVYFTRDTAGERLRAYYIMKQFANNAADSNYISSTKSGMDGAEVMSFRIDNRLIVWIINNSDSVLEDITVNVGGATISDAQIDRLTWAHWSGASGYPSETTRQNDNQFTTSLGANVMASFVFDLD